MNQLHEFLCRSHAWYDAWHKNNHANVTAWLVFMAVAVLYALAVQTVANDRVAQLNQEMFLAQAISAVTNRADGNTPEQRLLRVSNSALTKVNEHALSAPGKAGERLTELRTALEERYQAINELALEYPADVRRFVFDESSLATIPTTARDLVEKPFEREGVFHITLMSEFFEEDEVASYEEYHLEVAPGEVYRLALTEEEVHHLTPESSVTVSGVEIDDRVIIPRSFKEKTEGEPQVLGASTVKNIAVIPFNFRNAVVETLSADEINKRFFTNTNSVAAHIRDTSDGKWDFSGKVFNWVTIDLDATGCDYYAFATKAKEAIVARGESLSGYTNFHYLFPKSATSCGWGGIANMPGSQSWVISDYFGSGGISIHELGHNWGFHHASTPAAEYGDGSDPMGGARPVEFSNYNKGRYWLGSERYALVNTAGTYNLKELKSADGVVGIRVPRADGTTNQFLLEYRGSGAFDNALASTYVNKLIVRVVPNTFTTARTTQVAALGVGQSYPSTVDGITFTLLGVSSTTNDAVVKIDMVAAPCTRANPTVTAAPSGQWGTPGQALSYTVSVKNNDSSTCDSSAFAVNPTLPAGFMQSPMSGSLTLLPGELKSTSVAITSASNSAPATYVIQQVAQNTASTQNSGSVVVNYNIAPTDYTAPAVSITRPANGSSLSGSKVSVTASASDSSGIASLAIIIDGITLKTCSAATTCTYSWNLRKVSSGTHTIKAIAIDNSAQRNRAETQISVTR